MSLPRRIRYPKAFTSPIPPHLTPHPQPRTPLGRSCAPSSRHRGRFPPLLLQRQCRQRSRRLRQVTAAHKLPLVTPRVPGAEGLWQATFGAASPPAAPSSSSPDSSWNPSLSSRSAHLVPSGHPDSAKALPHFLLAAPILGISAQIHAA